jgi:hypothetical protein
LFKLKFGFCKKLSSCNPYYEASNQNTIHFKPGRLQGQAYHQGDIRELLEPENLHVFIKSHLCKGKMTYVFMDEIQNVKEFQRVVCSLFLDEMTDIYIADLHRTSNFIAKLTVHEFEGNGNRIYSVEAIEIKSSSGNLASNGIESQANATDWSLDPKIQQLLNSVNNVSKAVDENGEPEKVYMGDSASKTAFVAPQGNNFASSEKVAADYSNGETYSVFLDIRKPLFIDEESVADLKVMIARKMEEWNDMDDSELQNDGFFQELRYSYERFFHDKGSMIRNYYASFLNPIPHSASNETARDRMKGSVTTIRRGKALARST